MNATKGAATLLRPYENMAERLDNRLRALNTCLRISVGPVLRSFR